MSVCACMSVYVCRYIYVCAHICMYTCIYIYMNNSYTYIVIVDIVIQCCDLDSAEVGVHLSWLF